MKYKLFNEPSHSPIDQVLINRGIPEKRINEWINAGWPQINSPWLFGEEKIKHAISLISSNIYNDIDFYVVVDCD